MKIGYYSKKPVVIGAVQWDGSLKSVREIETIFPKLKTANISFHEERGTVKCWYIATLEGRYLVSPNDWIIRGIKGEYYPCKPDIFEASYQEERGYPYDRPETRQA
jgi:hypothetical protein